MAKESVLLQREVDAAKIAHLEELHKLQRDVETLKLLNQEYVKQLAIQDEELALWRSGSKPPTEVSTDEAPTGEPIAED